MKKLLFIVKLLLITIITCAQEKYPLETIIQKGHFKHVTCAAFSPDGKYIITGSYDNTIKLWNKENGKEIREFNKHTAKIRSVHFSSDGKYVLSASADNSAIIFDVLTAKPLKIFSIESDHLMKAIYSPDGKKVLTMNNRDEMIVWDISTGNESGKFKKSFKSIINPLWFSPDGKKIICYSSYKEAKVFDTETANEIKTLNFDKPYSVSYSKDGKYIAVGSTKLFAKVYDAETGNELFRFKDNEEAKCDGCNKLVLFSNNSKYLLTASKKAGLTLWDLKKGIKIRTYRELERSVKYVKFSSDDKYVMSANDKYIYVYNVKTGAELLKINCKDFFDFEAYFGPDEKYILIPGKNNTAELWSIASARKMKTYSGYLNKERNDGLKLSHTNWTQVNILKYLSMKSAVAISPDGKYIIKGNIDSTCVMIDISTGKIVKEFNGHSRIVYCFDFSKDGKYLITGGGDRVIKLWDTKTGKEIHTFRGHRDLVFDIKFSSDDKYIVSGSWDGSIRIWKTETGKELQYIKLDKNSPYVVGFTPNDLYVVSGDMDKNLKLWEVDAGIEFRNYIGHTDILSSFDFSPDGKKMVTGSWDAKVKVWDIFTGMLLNKFTGHEGAVYSIEYDPKGRFIASGSNDRCIKLFDPETGNEIKNLTGHSNSVTSVKITPDGKKLISCSIDGIIKVWDLETYKEIYTYIQIGRNDWLVKNTEGYFDGSSKALKLVNYVSGMEVITVGALFDKYYTPGLLKRLMQGETFGSTNDNINEMIKSSPKVDITVFDTEKHIVNILNDSVYKWREEVLPIRVNISDEGIGLEEIRIYNNGKLIINESLEGPVFRGGSKLGRSYDIKLSDGKNKITAVVLNEKRTESFPANIEVLFDGEAALTDLFILSIGINKYKNPAYTLNYAINDAKTYTKLVKEGAKEMFNSIEEYFLKDSEANKQNITKTFEEIISKAGPEDVFLFYYAGHGVMSTENKTQESDFYIVSYDVTNLYGSHEQLKIKALSATELMEFSRKILAEKQLFILDACHSGGALNAFAQRGAGREKALAQLARSTGTFFMTASQDIQYANEVGDLQHGMFTYAIIEALQGKADGGSADEKITVNELKSYVEDRVPELSEKYQGSPQYPTSYSFGQDFPIVIVK
ncbi:MAG: caspase family protein [Bacteroidales bacterium]|nr:caspase family protein [Bacteroidales bacterium]